MQFRISAILGQSNIKLYTHIFSSDITITVNLNETVKS
jgi:hypothetical protein